MSACWSVTVAVDAKDPVVDVGAVYRAFLRVVEARERRTAATDDDADEVFIRWSGGRVVNESDDDDSNDGDSDEDDEESDGEEEESSGSDNDDDDEGNGNDNGDDNAETSERSDKREPGSEAQGRREKDAEAEDLEDGTDADRADEDDDDDEAEEGDEGDERRMTPDEKARLLERQRERIQRGSQARTANVISNIMARLGDEGALVEELAGYDMEDSFIDDSELAPPARKKARHSGVASSSSDGSSSDGSSSSDSSSDGEGTRASQRHRHRHRHSRGEQASQEVDDPDAFAVGLGLPEPVFQALRDYRNSLLYSLHHTCTHARNMRASIS